MAAWTVEVRPPVEYVVCTEHQLGGHVDDDGVGDDGVGDDGVGDDGGGDVDGDGDACVDGMDIVVFISILSILINLILIDQCHTTFLISNPIMLLA